MQDLLRVYRSLSLPVTVLMSRAGPLPVSLAHRQYWKEETYGPIPNTVFDPGATCVLPASWIILAQRLSLLACAANSSSSSVVEPLRAIFGCLASGPPSTQANADDIVTHPCLCHLRYNCHQHLSSKATRQSNTEASAPPRRLTLGFASRNVSHAAKVACPACAAIFPLLIFKLSFTTKTNLTSSSADAPTDPRSDVRAAASSSESESGSVAPSGIDDDEDDDAEAGGAGAPTRLLLQLPPRDTGAVVKYDRVW